MKTVVFGFWMMVSMGAFALGCADVTAHEREASSSAAAETNDVMDLGDAQMAIAALSDQLTDELADVGPALSSEQQVAYAAQFAIDTTASVNAARAKYKKAADNISAYVKTRLPSVIDHAKTQSPNTSYGEELVTMYRVLAATEHASESLAFMNSLVNDPSFVKLMGLENEHYDAGESPGDVIARAVPNVIAKGLNDHVAPTVIMSQISDTLNKSISGSPISTWKGAFSAIDLNAAAKLRGRQHLDALLPHDEVHEISGTLVGKTVIGAGAAFALWNAKDTFASGDVSSFFQSFGPGSVDAAVLIAQFAEGVHAFEKYAKTVIEFGEHLGPGLDIVLSAVSTVQDIQSIMSNDPTIKTQLFGDAVTTIGAVVALTNPEIGAVVMGVGATAALVATIIRNSNAAAAEKAVKVTRLATVLEKGANKLSAADAARAADAFVSAPNQVWNVGEYPKMTSANPTQSSWVSEQRLGFTAEQIQQIARRSPTALSDEQNFVTGLRSIEMACFHRSDAYADLQQSRDDLFGMLGASLDALGDSGGDHGLALLFVSTANAPKNTNSCDGWISYLSSVHTNGADGLNTAAGAALTYVNAHKQ